MRHVCLTSTLARRSRTVSNGFHESFPSTSHAFSPTILIHRRAVLRPAYCARRGPPPQTFAREHRSSVVSSDDTAIRRLIHKLWTTCVHQKQPTSHSYVLRARYTAISKTEHRMREVSSHQRLIGLACDLELRRWSSESDIALAKLEAGLRAM